MALRQEMEFPAGFALSATERRALSKEIIANLKKENDLHTARNAIEDKYYDLRAKEASLSLRTGKEESENYKKRLNIIRTIVSNLDVIGKQQSDQLKASILPRGGTVPTMADLPMEWVGASPGKKPMFEIDEMIADTNKELDKQGNEQDSLRKKSIWQVVYWTTLGAAILAATQGSKVLGHYIDVITSALGFVLDMILLPMLPHVIQFVKFLFDVGTAFNNLPGPIKYVASLLTTFFLLFSGASIVLWLLGIEGGVAGIGTAAATAAGVGGVGALKAALGALVAPVLTIAVGVALTAGAAEMINYIKDSNKKGLMQLGMKEGEAGFVTDVGTSAMLGIIPGGSAVDFANKEYNSIKSFVVNLNLDGKQIAKVVTNSNTNEAKQVGTGVSGVG